MSSFFVSLLSTAHGATVLASEDFEHPNQPLVVNCGNSLDITGIATLYGRPGVRFTQYNTVEAVFVHDPSGLYSNPSGWGGEHAIGMLSSLEDDRLFLTLDARNLPFVDLGLRTSGIDIDGCGGPVGATRPVWNVTLHDSPTGFYVAGDPVLDSAVLTGAPLAAPFSFSWTYVTADLDASGATNRWVTLEFDLGAGGYAVLDDLSVVAAGVPGVYDRDTDRIADDVDNCPDDRNQNQADTDGDGVGDACAIVLADGGVCPGTFDFAATGLTPGRRATVLAADGVGGASAPPGGPCGGLVLGLDASVFVAGSLPISAAGEVSGSVPVGPGACGLGVQIVDNTTCTTSNVVNVGP